MAGFNNVTIDPYRFYLENLYQFNDASDLTNNNGITFVTGGKYGNCANLVAASSQYFSKTSATTLDPINNVAISIWFKLDSEIEETILSWGEDFNTSQASYGITIDSDLHLNFKIYLADGLDVWHLVGSTVLETDVFYNILVIFINKSAYLYLNGILEVTNDTTITTGKVSRFLLLDTVDSWGSLSPVTNSGVTFSVDSDFPIAPRTVAVFASNAYLYKANPTGLPSGSSARTLCCNVRCTNGTADQSAIYYGRSEGNGICLFGIANNHVHFANWGIDLYGSTTITDDTWYHIAMTYDGTTLKLYLDGVEDASTAVSLNTSLDRFYIGAGYAGSQGYYFTGNISDVRIYNTTLSAANLLAIVAEASPFAVPEPTTKTFRLGAHSDAGVTGYFNGKFDELYIWQNFTTMSDKNALASALYTSFYHLSNNNFFDYAIDKYIDNFIGSWKFENTPNEIINNVPSTLVNNPTYVIGKWGYSLYCYLEQGMKITASTFDIPALLNSKVFTINWWMKYGASGVGSGHYILGALNGDGNGLSMEVNRNGVSDNYRIRINGNNLDYSPGTDDNGIDSYTQLMLHCDGGLGSTVFTDSSASARAVTNTGSSTQSTAQFMFGTSAGYLPDSSKYLGVTIPAIGTQSFCIDFWAYQTSFVDGAYLELGSYNDSDGILWHPTNIFINHTSVFTYTNASLDEWHHYCLARDGEDVYLFIDGTLAASGTSSANISRTDLRIGSARYNAGYSLKGYFDEFRVSIGVYRRIEDFTPRTVAYSISLLGYTFADDAWHMHTIACDGTTFFFYLDSVLATSVAVSSITDVGLDFGIGLLNNNGTDYWLSELTVTFDEMNIWNTSLDQPAVTALLNRFFSKGNDIYTKALIQCNETNLVDVSDTANVITDAGTLLDTTNKVFGAGGRTRDAGSFSIPSGIATVFGDNDFSVEGYFLLPLASTQYTLFYAATLATYDEHGWYCTRTSDDKIFIKFFNPPGVGGIVANIALTSTAITWSTTRFHHVAFGRKNGTFFILVDFVSLTVTTVITGTAFTSLPGPVPLYILNAASSIDEIRITNGNCRYIASCPPQSTEWISNVAGYQYNLTLSNYIAFPFAFTIPTVYDLTLENSFILSGEEQKAFTPSISHAIKFVQKLGRQIALSLDSAFVLAMGSTEFTAFKSVIKFVQTLVASVGKPLSTVLSFAGTLTSTTTATRTLDSIIRFRQTIFASCVSCSSTTYRGYITLFYPYVSPTLTLDLRNPTFGDTDEVTLNIENQKLIGGQSLIFRPQERPIFEKLVYTFDTMTNKADFITFLETTFGEEIGLIDMQGVTWKGCITNDPAEIENYDRLNDAFGFTFEGDRQ